MAAPLLTTKLHIPPPGANLVPRPRLTERLGEGLDLGRRMTLISAPAGFGKTTLLSEWVSQSQIQNPESKIGWLSLDKGDNDPARFLAYLVAALQRAGLRAETGEPIGEGLLAAFQGPQPPPAGSLLTLLVNEIAALSQRLLLVLDDYHLVSAQEVHDAVGFLLDHLPGNLHLAMATRADPPLPVARLRARGQLTELRQEDLCFSPEEAASFLRMTLGLDLSPENVAALEARTEGWIAGLQMAALALQGIGLPDGTRGANGAARDLPGARHRDATLAEFIQAFTGSHRFILDYLVEEVLAQQAPAIQEFLLRTSILERLSGPLCDAILQTGSDLQPPSQEILQHLEASNLFIVPLDSERSWYRYHRLFADLLRQRLQEAEPGGVPTLHRRASQWYEQNGLPAPAIDHALAAADFERAADLVERAVEATLMRSEVATLASWIAHLPDGAIRARPDLCIAHAWTLLLRGHPLDQVEGWLQAAARPEDPSADTTYPSGRAATLRALLAVGQGRVSRAVELSRRALDRLPKQDLFWRSVAAWALSISQLADGDLGAGRQALEELAQTAQEMGNLMIAATALRHLARLRAREGQLHEAMAIYERALSLSRDKGGRTLPVGGDALIGMGDLWREWNDLGAATRYLLEGIELSRQWREISALYGYLSLARVRQAQGDAGGALDAIQEAQQVAVRFDATDLDDEVVALLQAQLWIAQGDLNAAQRWVEERGLGSDPDGVGQAESGDAPESHLRKYEQIVLARLLIAQARPDVALALLEPLAPRMEQQRRWGLVIEIQLLRALAFQARADTAGAMTALERALSLARPGGYVRIFLDEGRPMAGLLRQATARGIAPDYVGMLLAALEEEMVDEFPPSSLAPGPLPALVEPLTGRELEVLRLLAAGLSTPEVGQELIIATSTVRSHVKNIYGKLDVHRRWDAIRRAEELGLL